MRAQQIKSMLQTAYGGQDTSSFNSLDFIHALGSGRDALMYSQLFWPEFKEFKGMVFLAATVECLEDEKRVEAALQQYDGDLTKTEESFNLLEISYLFGKRIGETSVEEDNWLAAILCECWECRLKQLFPERVITVEIVPPAEVGDEVAISFFQHRAR
jgi:hypothetical protein